MENGKKQARAQGPESREGLVERLTFNVQGKELPGSGIVFPDPSNSINPCALLCPAFRVLFPGPKN